MPSVKARVAVLENTSKAPRARQLTDAERAVRLAHLLNCPEPPPVQKSLRESLKRALGRDVLL